MSITETGSVSLPGVGSSRTRDELRASGRRQVSRVLNRVSAQDTVTLDPDLVLYDSRLGADRSPMGAALGRLRHDRVAIAAIAIIFLLVAGALLAPLVVRAVGAPGPDVQSFAALNQFGQPSGPSGHHIFGVDKLGRDVFSRVVYGARVSLEVGFGATALSLSIGTVVGLVAGYFRGLVDSLLSRIVDLFLAFPTLLLALGISSACSVGRGCVAGTIRPGRVLVIAVIGLASWPLLARVIRGQVLSLREREFIEAAHGIGSGTFRVLFKELLPNLVGPLIVYATLGIAISIGFEAALSFLGVGIRPPTPSWGQMISDSVGTFDTAWWYTLFPGLALMTTVLAFNLLGDALHDALNPRQYRSANGE